jgi:putative intracellular protease/amidase
MSSKGTILVVGSNADTFILKDGKKQPAGFYLNELTVPIQAALDAGYDIVLATPTGEKPVVDAKSLDASHFPDGEQGLKRAVELVEKHPAMQHPRSLKSVVSEGLDKYIAVYVPGGHPPMVDLMQDPALGEILRDAHAHGKPTALLCHGPIAIAAAVSDPQAFRAALVAGDVEKAKELAKGWPYAGYRMTVFSNDEEHFAEEHYMGGSPVPFYASDALAIAGGKLEKTEEGIFKPYLVRDRELITGQNPPSDKSMADAFVKALDEATSKA